MSKRKAPSDKKIEELYLDKKLSSGDIANKYKMSRVCICRHINRLGITRPESGLDSRNRKRDGEVIKTGYPVFHLPEHPRASAIGYVFKHILEVEKKIGRTPLKSEPVHHIDIDRENYNIKNLHLCDDNSNHQKLHASLNKIITVLVRNGTIKFKNGKYYL